MATPLTSEQIEKIRDLHRRGLKQQEIAEKVGVTNPTVSRRLKMMAKEKKQKQSKPKFMDVPLIAPVNQGARVAIVVCKSTELNEVLGELWRQ